MFGKTGKQFANQISGAAEDFINKHFEDKGTFQTEQPTEQLGEIRGRRKALLIGINYYGQNGELRGCINDVRNIRQYLEKNYKFDEIRVLTDDQQQDPMGMPTRNNIINGFKWLRSGARSGDSLILHYSGHGGSVKDEDGDEEDGMDETLVPVDYQSAGQIVDDEIHDVLCRGLPQGVRLTGIMDCCHSESMLDLPYTYNINGDLEIIENDKAKGISKLVASGINFALSGNKKKAMKDVQEGMKLLFSGGKGGDSAARKKTIETRTTEADIVMFSGCKDNQTSADASINGQATGAMSYALIHVLEEGQNYDYSDMLRRMREVLAGKYTQVPMLSAGRKLDLEQPFHI